MSDDDLRAKLRRSGELRDRAIDLMRQGKLEEAAPLNDEATRLIHEYQAEVAATERRIERNRELGRGLKPVRLKIGQCRREVDGGLSFTTKTVPA